MGEDKILEHIRNEVAEFRRFNGWLGPLGMENHLMREMCHLLELYDSQSEELFNAIKESGETDQ